MTGRMLAVLLLSLAVAGSAVAVVYSKHESRRLFSLLEQENQTRDALDAEWGMLQLEQAAWATHGRVERIATDELDMKLPARDAVETLR